LRLFAAIKQLCAFHLIARPCLVTLSQCRSRRRRRHCQVLPPVESHVRHTSMKCLRCFCIKNPAPPLRRYLPPETVKVGMPSPHRSPLSSETKHQLSNIPKQLPRGVSPCHPGCLGCAFPFYNQYRVDVLILPPPRRRLPYLRSVQRRAPQTGRFGALAGSDAGAVSQRHAMRVSPHPVPACARASRASQAIPPSLSNQFKKMLHTNPQRRLHVGLALDDPYNPPFIPSCSSPSPAFFLAASPGCSSPCLTPLPQLLRHRNCEDRPVSQRVGAQRRGRESAVLLSPAEPELHGSPAVFKAQAHPRAPQNYGAIVLLSISKL
jgi:hypothetical protein